MRSQRSALRDAPLENLIRSLHATCRAEPGTTFSLETRLYIHEFPAVDELEILFSEVGAKNLAYTHDTGHARIQQALGGPDEAEWLDRYGDRCASAHLHDVHLLQDHFPPGAGSIDWDAVRSLLPSRALRTMEVNRKWPKEMLLEGLTYLQSHGFESAVV
ncbi:MAG: sugar phosphate isomerase/epimerase family protein [Planctomycetota bacterium]|jgi:sugar phosphate isomerase/epimerase